MAIFNYTFKVSYNGNTLEEISGKPFNAFSDVRLLNEELDNGYMEMISYDDSPFPMFSILQYEVSDGINTLTRQFYISRDQVETKGKFSNDYYSPTFLHKLELIELTKRWEKHECSTVCFTQPSNLSQTKYYTSIEQCLERLIRIEPIGEDDTSVSWAYGDPYSWLPQPPNRIITSVSAIENDIVPPQFFLQNLTLRQCCDALLKPLNSLSRYVLNFDANGDITTRQIQYENFNVLRNLLNISNMRIDALNEDMDIESYSTNTTSNIDNIVVENENVSPIIYPSSQNYDKMRADNETYLIDDSNFGVQTNYPIYFINQLLIPVEITFDYYDTSSTRQTVIFGNSDIDVTSRVFEEEVYNNFTNYFQNNSSASFLSKDSTLHYKRGGNFINCSNTFKKIVWDYSQYSRAILICTALQTLNNQAYYGLSGPTGPVNDYNIILRTPSWTGNSILGEINVTISNGVLLFISVRDPDPDELYYRIKYTPQYSSRLYFERENTEQHNQKSTNSMNQQQRIVSLQNYGNTVWSSAQRVGTLTSHITARHYAIADLLHIGDFIKQDNGSLNVITEAEYIYYNNVIVGKYTFSKDYNRISEFIGIDNEIRQFDIPSDSRSYERKVNIQNYLEISPVRDIYTSYLTKDGRDLLLDIFVNNSSTETVGLALYTTTDNDVKNKWGLSAVITDPRLLLPIIVNGAGNSIIMQFGFNNNITHNLATINVIGSGNSKKILKSPIPYAKGDGNYKGFLRNCSFELYGYSAYIGNGGSLPIVSVTHSISGNPYVSIPSLMVLKDPSEILQFTYQINILSKNPNIIIGRKFAENNRMINKNEPRPVVYTKNGNISRFDNYKLIGGTLDTDISYTMAISQYVNTMTLYKNGSPLSSTNKPNTNIYLVDPTTQEIYLIIKKEFFDNYSTIYFNFLKDRSDINNNF